MLTWRYVATLTTINIIIVSLTVLFSITAASSTRRLALERILSEYREISSLRLSFDFPFNGTKQDCGFRLSPLKRNIHEWHFSFLGPENSPYSGGCYHGKIVLPADYPNKAPSISMITPSGRWVPGMEICLSASNFHQETWNPNWSLRTLVLGLRLHMTSQATEIGSASASLESKLELARKSMQSQCSHCGACHNKLIEGLQKSELSEIEHIICDGHESTPIQEVSSFDRRARESLTRKSKNSARRSFRVRRKKRSRH